MRNRIAFLVTVTALLLVPPIVAEAAPPEMITKCADAAFRQHHLAECNRSDGGLGFGGGGGGGKGLLGVLGDAIGSVGGLL